MARPEILPGFEAQNIQYNSGSFQEVRIWFVLCLLNIIFEYRSLLGETRDNTNSEGGGGFHLFLCLNSVRWPGAGETGTRNLGLGLRTIPAQISMTVSLLYGKKIRTGRSVVSKLVTDPASVLPGSNKSSVSTRIVSIDLKVLSA